MTRNRLDDFDPAWSPDGRRIVFARGKIDTNANRVEHSALYLMDANGRHARQLTSRGPDTAPSWAPSGRRIVFARNDVVSILDLGTGRIHSLAGGVDPAWSPDGRLIALAAGARLEAVRPDGRGARTLFDGGDEGPGITTQISRPSWSPDGGTISFHLRYDHGRWSEDGNVIVSRTGETRGTLHCIPSSPPSFELESYDTGTAWSPDGQWVAADGVAVCRTDGSTGYWLSPGLEADWQRRIQR